MTSEKKGLSELRQDEPRLNPQTAREREKLLEVPEEISEPKTPPSTRDPRSGEEEKQSPTRGWMPLDIVK